MDFHECITQDFPKTHPFEGVNAIYDTLHKEKYIVAIDEENTFHGILTVEDLIIHPHNLVIDCISPKKQISLEDDITEILHHMQSERSCVLPVFSKGEFYGIINRLHMFDILKKKVADLHEKSRVSYKVKDAFLNNLSHEIRTPLNGMMGFLQLLSQLEDVEYETKGKDYCDYVFQSAKRFITSMTDLIELSKLDAGETIKLEITEFDITDFFIELHAQILTDKELLHTQLELTNSNSTQTITTDRFRLQKIVLYIIDFIFKQDKQTYVQYGCTEKSNTMKFFVRFSSKHNCNEIRELCNFKDNTVLLDELTKHYNGIGLPLAKYYIELLNGSLEISEKNESIEIACVFSVLNR